MSTILTIRDEEMSGKIIHEFSMECLSEQMTVRELIRSRVFQEVKDHNAKANLAEFTGLVQPTGAEKTLNGFRLKKPRRIDWKIQFEKAVDAFEGNQILIIVNDRQVETLEEEIDVATDTSIAFLRLTLLVGG